jgi:dTDP-glucose 4,6-dehydratase
LRNILVTGGAGFIGANFVHHSVRHRPQYRYVILDALSYAGNVASLEPVLARENVRFVHGDIRDDALVDALLGEESIDTVIHFAAESHVDRSISGPDAFLETNVTGTHVLLKAARKLWAGSGAAAGVRFHHVSTDEVYGTLAPGDPAFTELTPYAPNSPYAATKAASDHLVRAYHHTYGLPVTTSNCSNNYGPYQFPEKLIPLAIVNALEGRPIPVYGDGMQQRDWLFVEDHCRAVWQVLESGRPGETYNIGGGGEVANLHLLRELCAAMDAEMGASAPLRERFPASPPANGASVRELITHVADRPGHDRRYAIDFSKAAGELGYAPGESLESGLRRTVRWYLDNESWWRAIMDGSYRKWISEQYGAALSTPS